MIQETKHRKSSLIVGATAAILGFAGGFAPVNAFTEEQAVKGKLLYSAQCAQCHGTQLEGKDAPGLSDDTLHNFQTAAGLFGMMSVSMPPQNPGALSDESYLNIIAYVLSYSGALPDGIALTADEEALEKVDMVAEIAEGRKAGGRDKRQKDEETIIVSQAYTFGMSLPGGEQKPDVPATPSIPQAFTFGMELPKAD